MTKAEVISDIKAYANRYRLHFPKDLSKRPKAELEVMLADCKQASENMNAYEKGVHVW